MAIEFSNKDILLIYGHFMKKIKELEAIKSAPNNPIDSNNIDQDIELYSSITSKIENSNPQILKLKELM
jgi:hypothetical protein